MKFVGERGAVQRRGGDGRAAPVGRRVAPLPAGPEELAVPPHRRQGDGQSASAAAAPPFVGRLQIRNGGDDPHLQGGDEDLLGEDGARAPRQRGPHGQARRYGGQRCEARDRHDRVEEVPPARQRRKPANDSGHFSFFFFSFFFLFFFPHFFIAV